MWQSILLALNLLSGLVSSFAGIVALFRPQALTRSFTGFDPVAFGEKFYAYLYAARAIPFGIAAGLLPYCHRGPAVLIVLILAAAIQTGDIAIGIGVKSPRIITGASLAALTHLLCALILL